MRDAFIGKPVQDIDLATSHKPQKIMSYLEKEGIKVIPTGLAHGTVMAVLEGEGFEITTLRRDDKTDGRHAVVTFTDDWEEDAARRDFTFNALYLKEDGEIYDPWGGIEDLKRGIAELRVRPRSLPEAPVLAFSWPCAFWGKQIGDVFVSFAFFVNYPVCMVDCGLKMASECLGMVSNIIFSTFWGISRC